MVIASDHLAQVHCLILSPGAYIVLQGEVSCQQTMLLHKEARDASGKMDVDKGMQRKSETTLFNIMVRSFGEPGTFKACNEVNLQSSDGSSSQGET